MGNKRTITHNTFPKQGDFLGNRVKVMFHYDTDHVVMGTIIRDDMEEPGVEIIKLDDGRVVLTTECQWSPL